MLISNAYAQATTTASTGPFGDITSFIPMIVIFVLFYFMLIRPQQKKAKELKAMLDAVKKGDEVITAGGMVGKVSKTGEAYVTLEIAPNTEILVQKAAIQAKLETGTIKTL